MSYSKLDLSGKVAVVIGGTSGIGRAIACGLAEAGADVVPTSRRIEHVSEAASEIKAYGRRSLAVATDTTRREDLLRLRAAVLDELGRVDILVNSAGMTKKIPTLEVSEEDWDAIINCNLKGPFLACQVFGELMIKQGKGKIINICSVGSFRSIHEVTPYCASKGGLAMLTRCLGSEWARYGVNVNGIAPGWFRTPLNAHLLDIPERRDKIISRTPLGRFGQLEELKGAAIYLASDASDFVCGEIIAVDGGFLATGI